VKINSDIQYKNEYNIIKKTGLILSEENLAALTRLPIIKIWEQIKRYLFTM